MYPSLTCSSTNNILSAGNLAGDETGEEYEALPCVGDWKAGMCISVPQDYGAFRGHQLIDLQSEQGRSLSLVDQLAGASVLQNQCQLYL